MALGIYTCAIIQFAQGESEGVNKGGGGGGLEKWQVATGRPPTGAVTYASTLYLTPGSRLRVGMV